MHDHSAQGVEIFRCDFCASPWAEDRPMIEGHRGSLICGQCLRTAFTVLAIQRQGREPGGWTCTMCIEERTQPGWQSPLRPEATVCLRCVKQSATQMEKDPDTAWSRPTADA